MSYKMLVPLDGSRLSEGVFPVVRYFARHLGEPVSVRLARCFEPPGTLYVLPDLALPVTNPMSDSNLGERVLEYLSRKAKELEEFTPSTHLLIGDPAQEVLKAGEEADLVVMASHGRGGLGRWLLGSVASKVVKGSTTPVLVVNAETVDEERSHLVEMKTIVVGLDGSEVAERALQTAADLAGRFGARLVLYQGATQAPVLDQSVVEANHQEMLRVERYLKGLAAELEGIETDFEVGQALERSSGLVTFAEEQEADLLVLGSHGRSGLVRWMIGSETERALHEAHCPVLVTH